jgi:hypothetical protein
MAAAPAGLLGKGRASPKTAAATLVAVQLALLEDAHRLEAVLKMLSV